MKVILTGVNGFVGKNLSEYLQSKNHQTAFISLRTNNWMLDNTANAILHLAAKAHDTSNVANPESYFEVNTELTKQIFKKFLKSDIQDFFYFSSVKAVADTFEVGLLTEEASYNAQTAYGRSKAEAEKYLLSQKLPNNKRLFIIRPCIINGAGNKGNLNLLYQFVKYGLPWPLGSFDNKRSFLYVDNLSFLIDKMLNNSLPSGIYNFADDGFLSTNNLINIIANSLQKKASILKINPLLIENIAKIGNVLKLPLNTERLKKLTENYQVSNQKIKMALNIEVLPISSEEGLSKTIKNFTK